MMKTTSLEGTVLFTVGHSNQSVEDLMVILESFDIEVVADIRRYPSSRKFPHFNQANLKNVLTGQGLGYVWIEGLGGRRHGGAQRGSRNEGIRSAGFRNYADHMASAEFAEGLRTLLSQAAERRTALMCAEKFYFKCHRWILSDQLVALGATVEHILGPGQARRHVLSKGAEVGKDGIVTYPLKGQQRLV